MLNNLGTEGIYLNMIQVMYGKPTGDIILKGGRLEVFFPLRSFSPLLFNIVMKVLARANKEEKEIRHPNKNGRKSIVLVTDGIIFHIENSKDSTKNLSERIHKLSKAADHQINIEKPVVFLYTSNELIRKKSREPSHLQSH